MTESKPIDEAERVRRQAAVNYARGTVRLEGFVISHRVEDLFASYVAGDVEAEEIMPAILRMHAESGLKGDATLEDEKLPLREQLAAIRRDNPLPEPTGLKADKAFFDSLSGEDNDDRRSEDT